MGGAAGHMKHPFDLPAVETGEDLKQFFETAADWVLENTAALKIDGVNASFKLIDSEGAPNGKEFALDRGSAKPIDIEGITTARVGERWPEEHGMYSATKILLDIFNRALWHEDGAYIKEELEQLGVWDDSTVIFNTEFVLKNLNVKEYKTNFIALHGINKFSWATKRRRASKEIAYNRDALETLRDKVAPFAKTAKNMQGENLDMEVYTSVPVEPLRTEVGDMARADFSNTLNNIFPIHQRYGEPPVERSLGDWLTSAVNPIDTKIPLVTGRKVGALSKEIYKVVLNTTEPLADLLGEDEENIKLARDGAIFYHATRLLGNDVLSTLTAGEDFGSVNEEEGIVLRDRIAFGTDDPVKITGNFILGGEAGKLAQKARAPAKETEKTGNIIALFPGGFKPPHAGHFELAKRYAEDPQVSKVLMLLGPAIRTSKDGSIKITKESSIHVISEFYKQYLGDKVVIADSPAGEENPMRAAFKWIEESAQPGEIYTLAASTKDPKRAAMFVEGHKCPGGKYCKEGVQVVLHPVDTQALVYSGRTDGLNGIAISASVMREDLANDDKQNFATNLPAEAADYVDEIFDFLGGVKKIEEPASPFSLDEPIEEASAMGSAAGGVGSVEGYSGRKKKNRNKETNYPYMTESEKQKMLKEELTLRKHIRTLIERKHQKRLEEEQTLRDFIRKIIKEAKIEDSPTKSTGINKLVSVLKIVLPTIEKSYKSLTTDKAQRESFIKHYIHAIINTLSPQDAMEAALEGGAAPMAESLIMEQEADPTKFIDVGIRTDAEKEEEEATAAAEKEEENKVSKEEAAETKKMDDEAIEDIGGEKQPFPELPGLDLTGRDEAIDVYKKTIDAITRGYGKLHMEKDEEHFKDYLITNLLLYRDKFEADVGGELADLTTPEYEAAAGDKEKYMGGEGEMPPPEGEELPPEAAALQEKITTAVRAALNNI